MRKRIFGLFGMLLVVTALSAQVNLQTGAAEQSFPLIDYTDSKAGLSLGVGLGYSSGNGLMVNEVATDVGTGWSLEAGGSIVRIQNGEPDDQKAYGDINGTNAYVSRDNPDGLKNLAKCYYAGYLYSDNVGLGCSRGLHYYPLFTHSYYVYKQFSGVRADVEQDKFLFHFGGRSGAFVIGKDMLVHTLGDSKINVTFSESDMTSQGIRTTINKFIITTEDGIQYTFSELSLSKMCQYKYSQFVNNRWEPIFGSPSNNPYVINRFYGYPFDDDMRPYIVTSWQLSEIKNTNNNQIITFQYQQIGTDIITSKYISHVSNLSEGEYANMFTDPQLGHKREVANSGYPHPIPTGSDPTDQATNIIYNRSISVSKRISKILLPNNGTINFLYNYLPRADLAGEHSLTGINYFINNQFVRGYNLEYGYLFKNSIKPYTEPFDTYNKLYARLCLLSIQKVGNGFDNATEPPYKFDYITGDNSGGDNFVPARNFLAQDHWGYYNGTNSDLPLNVDHDFLSSDVYHERIEYYKTVAYKNHKPKSLLAQNGLLSSVTYPTGGTITYSYVQNKYFDNLGSTSTNQDINTGGVSVDKTIMYDGENHTKDIIKQYKYIDTKGHSSRWGYETPTYYSLSENFYIRAAFKKRYKYGGAQYPEMAISIDMGKILGKAILNMLISAGIQVAATAAFGAYLTGAGASIYENLYAAAIIIAVALLSSSHTLAMNYTLCNQNNINANPLGERYYRVEVQTNSPTGYDGKTIYEFTSVKDYYPTPELYYYPWPYTQAPRKVDWAYGLPKSVIVKDKNNTVVKESYNIYNLIRPNGTYNTDIAYPIVNKYSPTLNSNCNCESRRSESVRQPNWDKAIYNDITSSEYNYMTPRFYNYFSGHVEQLGSYEKLYNTAGSLYYEDKASILTDPRTLLQTVKITQKDPNSTISQITYYPSDYTMPTGSPLALLVQRNAIHTPVSTETWETKTELTYDGDGQTIMDANGKPVLQTKRFLIDASVTEFTKPIINGIEVKPSRIYTLKTNAPLPESVIGKQTDNTSVLLRHPEFYKLKTEMFYDAGNNLVQTISDGNVTSFVNDYLDRYVVASVANAAYNDIAYTSFESNGKGNWSYSTSNINSNDHVTGLKSFHLSNGNSISRSGLGATGVHKKYTVTYWVKTADAGSVTVNSQSATELYKTADGWSLYSIEIDIYNTTTGSISIDGNATIDEVRLYPTGSLMSTVTYQEGIGKITECDANNRLLFYEYDAIGRLKLIRDQNKNVIKTYEYNYKH